MKKVFFEAANVVKKCFLHPLSIFMFFNTFLTYKSIYVPIKNVSKKSISFFISNNFIHLCFRKFRKTKSLMTIRDIELRLKMLKDQLKLIDDFEDEFLEIDGIRGLEKRRDNILDEINYLNRLKKKKQ